MQRRNTGILKRVTITIISITTLYFFLRKSENEDERSWKGTIGMPFALRLLEETGFGPGKLLSGTEEKSDVES